MASIDESSGSDGPRGSFTWPRSRLQGSGGVGDGERPRSNQVSAEEANAYKSATATRDGESREVSLSEGLGCLMPFLITSAVGLVLSPLAFVALFVSKQTALMLLFFSMMILVPTFIGTKIYYTVKLWQGMARDARRWEQNRRKQSR